MAKGMKSVGPAVPPPRNKVTLYLKPEVERLARASAEDRGQMLSIWIERACVAELRAAGQVDASLT